MSSITSLFRINGVVSTDKTVLQNLNDLCSASNCLLTYDVADGKWSVIINKPRSVKASFDDSNIIGNIDIAGTGVTELYNSVSIEFPHSDLKDTIDYVDLELPLQNRFPNEIDNRLNIQFDCINDPVQAQYLAQVELNQNRLDKIIEFTADYSYVGLKAGDIIAVTSEMYGYTNKTFRIIRVSEDDNEGIQVRITGLEYDASVFNVGSLIRLERSKRTGILIKTQNPAVQASETVNFGSQMARMLAANAGLSLLNKMFKRVLDGQGNPTDGFAEPPDDETIKMLNGAKIPEITNISSSVTTVCAGQSVSVSVSHSCTSCFFNIPNKEYNYTITGVASNEIGIPLTGKVTVVATQNGGLGTLVIPTTQISGTASKTMAVNIGGFTRNITVRQVVNESYQVVANPTSITEGGNSTITITTTGVSNGTVVPYSITGSGTARVSSPLTGNITINNNTATFTLQTIDDQVFTGSQSVTFTVDPGWQSNPCSTGARVFSASVSILDNDSPPPPPPPDVTRQYISTPVVWVGTYDGVDSQLKSLSVVRSAFLPVPFPGEATVQIPLTVSVSKGNPSTITVTSTRAIASTQILGGTAIEIITAFNTVAPNAQITGTRTTVYGFY